MKLFMVSIVKAVLAEDEHEAVDMAHDLEGSSAIHPALDDEAVSQAIKFYNSIAAHGDKMGLQNDAVFEIMTAWLRSHDESLADYAEDIIEAIAKLAIDEAELVNQGEDEED